MRSTAPAGVSDLRRLDNNAGDIFGSPRRRSLKCALPRSNSLTTSSVHRSSSNSIALAIGQNWPYVDIVLVERLLPELTSTDRELHWVQIRHWKRPSGPLTMVA